MVTVIFYNCRVRYNSSPEEGQSFYRNIFILQTRYAKYKDEVDAKLIAAGLQDCIVTE